MMRILWVLSLLIATSSLNATTTAPTRLDDAEIRTFLTHIYTSYKECSGKLPCIDPVPWRTVFTPATSRLISVNERLNAFEAGAATDADPICQCQDYHTIKLISITLSSWPHKRIRAVVRFINAQPQQISLLMEKTPAGWRVYDVLGAPGSLSYRDGVIAENRSLTKVAH
ncbi:YqhG/Tai3 family protein [Rhizorhabdus argentea]|uniref:hypothetical protein n=1 Tax=Rhizorhabdus argentea TaxID=1387174 RepID=UPI0030EC012E